MKHREGMIVLCKAVALVPADTRSTIWEDAGNIKTFYILLDALPAADLPTGLTALRSLGWKPAREQANS